MSKESQEKFYRKCPRCGGEQQYSRLDGLVRANRRNALCKKCVFKGRPISEEQKKLLRKRTGSNNPMFGRKASVSTRMKMSVSQKKVVRPPMTEEAKQKLRLYRAKWVNEFAGGPQYNPVACKFFNELNKKKGWNLQHAENGGEFYVKELGYFLDAYDKDRNIVVEYDEPKHYTVDGMLKQKDVIRQNQIVSLLGCQFYRYNQLTEQFKAFRQIPIYETTEVV